jgi:hypothetical protein
MEIISKYIYLYLYLIILDYTLLYKIIVFLLWFIIFEIYIFHGIINNKYTFYGESLLNYEEYLHY